MQAGYELRIAELRQALGAGPTPQDKPKNLPRKRKRRLSAAGRANIIAALKKRWAERHKKEAEARAAAKHAPQRKAKPAPKAKARAKSPAKSAMVKAKKAPASKAAGKTPPRPRATVAAPEPKAPATEAR